MFIEDEGLIINIVKYADNKKIIKVFTANNGMRSFVIRFSKKNHNTAQIGSLINIQWRNNTKNLIFALHEQKQSAIHNIIQNYHGIILLNALIDILNTTIVEQNIHRDSLYKSIKQILNSNIDNDHDYYKQLVNYCNFEIILLKDSGYALSLDKCAVSGSTTGLKYISPKSGCAVTEKFGRPYKDKLFTYPVILQGIEADADNIKETLIMLRYFITKQILQPNNKQIPKNRLILEQLLAI
ncbi:DNA repair protein RecO [Candidatus Xenohaliotis californiensis]|uniref:DNA repair protein RecO n=1 Tax=Candidatus Xenohaliotis californiensis TaxID=84677 RepID=A0ABM9N9E4_9RICK|nr:DNA repair protein RecO [Candidatus Xenohaliotis californiensis]